MSNAQELGAPHLRKVDEEIVTLEMLQAGYDVLWHLKGPVELFSPRLLARLYRAMRDARDGCYAETIGANTVSATKLACSGSPVSKFLG